MGCPPFSGLQVPCSFINSLIRYMESKLTLAFRTQMVKHTYDKYPPPAASIGATRGFLACACILALCLFLA